MVTPESPSTMYDVTFATTSMTDVELLKNAEQDLAERNGLPFPEQETK